MAGASPPAESPERGAGARGGNREQCAHTAPLVAAAVGCGSGAVGLLAPADRRALAWSLRVSEGPREGPGRAASRDQPPPRPRWGPPPIAPDGRPAPPCRPRALLPGSGAPGPRVLRALPPRARLLSRPGRGGRAGCAQCARAAGSRGGAPAPPPPSPAPVSVAAAAEIGIRLLALGAGARGGGGRGGGGRGGGRRGRRGGQKAGPAPGRPSARDEKRTPREGPPGRGRRTPRGRPSRAPPPPDGSPRAPRFAPGRRMRSAGSG